MEEGHQIWSVSLYYMAKRNNPISKQEQEACRKVAERYIAEYPWGDMDDGFCIYDLNETSEENVIFEGATKLPVNRGKARFIKVHDYWSDCLQEIIYLLPGAQWYIRIDDTDVTPYFDYPQQKAT